MGCQCGFRWFGDNRENPAHKEVCLFKISLLGGGGGVGMGSMH